MSKVTLEQGEARAVLRAVAGLQESVQAAEVSLEEASRFFEAYDKMARDLAEKLRTSQAALKRAELMVTLAVGAVREHGTPEVKEAMAAKLRAEVKPANEYLAAPSEVPGALRNAVTGAERKWKRAVTAEAKVTEERDRDLEALEEALRRAARANPSRLRATPSGDGEEVSPEVLSPPPQRVASGVVGGPATGRVSSPSSPRAASPSSPRTASPAPQQRSPGPVRSPNASSLVVVRAATPESKKEEGEKEDAKKEEGAKSEARNDGLIPSPRRAGAPRPASPRKENAAPAAHEELKESKPSTYDSDLDGGTSESEANILPTVLRQMTAAPGEAAGEKDRISPARPARLEKTRGSIALPRGESLETWSEEGRRMELKAVAQEEKKNVMAEEMTTAAPAVNAKPAAAASQGGLPRRILSLFRTEGEGEEEKEEEAEMVISGPVNVSHAAHIGPNNLAEADALFRKEEEKRKEEEMSASKKRMSSPIRLLSLRGKSRQTVRDDDKDGKGGGEEEEESNDDGFEITGPTEVTHQGHVDTGVKDAAAVADVIDSVVNKERPVDVENVYAEELQFAEEYNPNL